MSEFLAGMPEMPPPKPPRDAAVVVLFRSVDDGRRYPSAPGEGFPDAPVEVFWLKREAKLKFAGGFYAFPGGKLDTADASVPVEGESGLAATLIATAARELFEETGVLHARGAQNLSQATIDELRKALLAQTLPFSKLLSDHALSLHGDDFLNAGRWLTPDFMPVRFDTRFYLVQAPPWANAVVWPGELSEGEWIKPGEALKRWEAGTALLHPPNRFALETMRHHVTFPSTVQVLCNPPDAPGYIAQRIEMQRGVQLFPLRTPTLPPATHTNCYLLGRDEVLIVDPGSPDDAEVDRLIVHLQRRIEKDGLRLRGVLLTHHHGDHIGGLSRLVQTLKLKVFAHPLTANRLPVPTDVLVNDGDVIDLPGMPWRALHTPGHARGHLCLIDEVSRAAVVGDMVAGVGTIVIDPPEGEMGEYLRQLQRLRDLPVRTLYPAHGAPLPDGPGKLDEYLAHRAWREQKVVAALDPKGLTVDELVPRAYDDVAAFVHPIAERNTVAILDKLLDEGRVEHRDGRYFPKG